jgi:uncharacterized protein (DUF58 family)
VLTRLGWQTAGAATVLGGAGLLLRWPAVLALGTVLAAPCLAALAYLLRRPELRLERRIAPERVVKDGLAIAHLNVQNRSRRAYPGDVGVQHVADHTVTVELPRLARGERELATQVLPTSRRGWHEVSPVVVQRSDPFGLARVERRYTGVDQLLVLPKVLPFRPLRTTRTRSVDGSTDDTDPHGTMVFHRLREYVPGDDVRRIHWKATARTAHSGELIVRQDVDEAQPYVVILVDLRPQGYSPASFELALDAAASAIAATTEGRAPFELRTTAGTSFGGPTNHATAPAMEALALAEPDTGGSLALELQALRRLPGGAGLVVVTGVPVPADLSAMAALRSRFQRVMLLSVTPEPRPPQLHPGLTLIQGADEQQLVASWNMAVGR